MEREKHGCGGSLQHSTAMLVVRHEEQGHLAFVLSAPALRCDQCGKELLELDVAKELETILKRGVVCSTEELPLCTSWALTVLYVPTPDLKPLSSEAGSLTTTGTAA